MLDGLKMLPSAKIENKQKTKEEESKGILVQTDEQEKSERIARERQSDNEYLEFLKKDEEYLASMKIIDPDEYEDCMSWREIHKMTEEELITFFEKNWQNSESYRTSQKDSDYLDNSKEGFIRDQKDIDGLMLDEMKDELDYDFFNNQRILIRLAQIGGEKAVDFAVDFVANNNESMHLYGEKLFSIISEYKTKEKYATEKIISILLEKRHNEVATFRLLLLVLRQVQAEDLRSILNGKMEKAGLNQEEINNLEYINSFITPNGDKKAIRNLQEFYQTQIRFEDYKVNKLMNEKEVGLLKTLIPNDGKVLEMGCGTGRLITEMAKAGYDISGFDYTERHAQITGENLKREGLKAKVFQGDWHNIGFGDENFDTAYSLGRNILHDYSVTDQNKLFKEASRILKKDGRFIFDIPNRENASETELAKLWSEREERMLEYGQDSGDEKTTQKIEEWENGKLAGYNGYEKLVLKYGLEMLKMGIYNFRFGAIYDSPDGKNFATRYSYSTEDIEMLAQMVGFEIAEVKKEKLETGKDDENLYFILKKKK
ncbi:MAG: class I SAM-dependent methyltransferase [Candidatus Moraniibacteriota bacterium]